MLLHRFAGTHIFAWTRRSALRIWVLVPGKSNCCAAQARWLTCNPVGVGLTREYAVQLNGGSGERLIRAADIIKRVEKPHRCLREQCLIWEAGGMVCHVGQPREASQEMGNSVPFHAIAMSQELPPVRSRAEVRTVDVGSVSVCRREEPPVLCPIVQPRTASDPLSPMMFAADMSKHSPKLRQPHLLAARAQRA